MDLNHLKKLKKLNKIYVKLTFLINCKFKVKKAKKKFMFIFRILSFYVFLMNQKMDRNFKRVNTLGFKKLFESNKHFLI